MSRKTDSQLQTQFDVITNETVRNANNEDRIGSAYSDLKDSSQLLPETISFTSSLSFDTNKWFGTYTMSATLSFAYSGTGDIGKSVEGVIVSDGVNDIIFSSDFIVLANEFDATNGANNHMKFKLQDNGKIWTEILNESNGTSDVLGHLWEFVLGGTYISATSSLGITASNRIKIPIDGGFSQITSPNYNGNVWNISTNKIEPITLNDFYEIRFAITGHSDIAQTNRFDVEFDVGGSAGIIFRETAIFGKGAGNAQSFNFSMPLFVGSDFKTNGGEIYITPLADASFWEIAITISRTYTPGI